MSTSTWTGSRLDPEQGEGAGEREHGGDARRRRSRAWRADRHDRRRRELVAIDARRARAGARLASPAMTVASASDSAARAEELVAARLERAGWRIVERNVRTARRGELDLVALDGATLVFVEVKARPRRRRARPGAPGASRSGRRKQLKLRAARRARGSRERGDASRAHRELRFDVVGVSFGPDGRRRMSIEHLRGAF